MNVSDFDVGMAEFLLINTVITPPAVSRPNDNGATSINSKSSPLLPMVPFKIAAYTAAPYATASSGLIDLLNSFPLNLSRINY